jgi:hypothetical protein
MSTAVAHTLLQDLPFEDYMQSNSCIAPPASINGYKMLIAIGLVLSESKKKSTKGFLFVW